MTTSIPDGTILKRDRLGRITTPRERRETLLKEFDQSGMSGAQFAQWAGIKYPTFASWVQQRREQAERRQKEHPEKSAPVAVARIAEKPKAVSTTTGAVQWVEAMEMAQSNATKDAPCDSRGAMVVQGPRGVRLELHEERHVLWAVKLLRQLEKPC